MKKILVVDDEQDMRCLIKNALTRDKFSVITASSGEEAVVLAKTDKPHLILLDICMPGMDGYVTCEKLKKDPKTKNIPVLFLTAKDLEEKGIIERCENLDALGYVSKISPFKELAEKVRKVLFRS